MNEDKFKIIMVLGKPYSMDIMQSLFESPKRFTDINKACPIEKTRAKRLKELTDEKLIEAVIKPISKRNFVHYKLTKKGENIFKKIVNID